MPTAETLAGKPVDVTPADEAAIKAQFSASLNDDGPDEQATPKRQPKAENAEEKPRARTSKADKARTTDKAAPVVKDDYTEDAGNFVGSVWTVAALFPASQPYALIVDANSDALAGALADGAKHNSTIRAFVDSGKSSWILALAGVGLNMGMQAYAMARDPELQAHARATTMASLKERLGAKGIEVPGNEPAAA